MNYIPAADGLKYDLSVIFPRVFLSVVCLVLLGEDCSPSVQKGRKRDGYRCENGTVTESTELGFFLDVSSELAKGLRMGDSLEVGANHEPAEIIIKLDCTNLHQT